MDEGRSFEPINSIDQCPIKGNLELAYRLVNYNNPELRLEEDYEFCGFVKYTNTDDMQSSNFTIVDFPILKTSCIELRDNLREILEYVKDLDNSNNGKFNPILILWEVILVEAGLLEEECNVQSIVREVKKIYNDIRLYATGDSHDLFPTISPLECSIAPTQD